MKSRLIGKDPDARKDCGQEEKGTIENEINSVQSLSCVRLFVTPWTAACQASLSITNSRSLLKLMSIAIQPSYPLSSPSPLAFSLSQHQDLLH